jgi:hypothetical protein
MLMIGYGVNHDNTYFFGFSRNDYNSPEYPNDVNNWVFLTYTYNFTTKSRKIYRNGIFIGGDTSPSQLALDGTTICIGNLYNIAGYSTNGFYDDFRIYNEIELNQSQILELYENSKINFIINGNSISRGTNYISSTDDYPLIIYENSNIINPIIWYKFDDSSTQMLLDSSGNGYNLTNNGATFDTTNFIKGNGSVSFNHSSSQFLSIPSINLYNIQSVNGISISLWFRMNVSNTGSFVRLFDFNNGFLTINF